MKYMRIGTKPDTFYTEEAVRSVLSDVPTDLIVEVNNTKYLLHKFPLLLKCGLVQRLCSNNDSVDSDQPIQIALHDIPGGEEAFELCAKFCYGISINLSAHNFAEAISAAKFLRMTESVAQGNFVAKLELFFESCVLLGWKDSILTLQAMWRQSGWSDDDRIVHPCLNSVVEKILIHPEEVTWSYTYTRPGYTKKQQTLAPPKDWWTEDVSDLDLELFRSIISTVRSTNQLPAALIGEALHVYACKHLPSPLEIQGQAQSSSARTDDALRSHRKVLEAIVSMIPTEQGSVSGRFLFRLLKIANYVGASSSVKAELITRSGRQMDEVTAHDLIIPLASNPQSHDISMVDAVLDSFLLQIRQLNPQEATERIIMSMTKVGSIYDAYLQIIASDGDLPVSKFIELAKSLPEMARPDHDRLYQAIDIYLKEHPQLSKTDKKRLCRMIDCQNLSPEARANAIANDHFPLRTIVQLLFIDQERSSNDGASQVANALTSLNEVSNGKVAEEDTGRSTHGSGSEHQHEEPVLGARAEKARTTPSPSESEMVKERKQHKAQEFGGKYKKK